MVSRWSAFRSASTLAVEGGCASLMALAWASSKTTCTCGSMIGPLWPGAARSDALAGWQACSAARQRTVATEDERRWDMNSPGRANRGSQRRLARAAQAATPLQTLPAIKRCCSRVGSHSGLQVAPPPRLKFRHRDEPSSRRCPFDPAPTTPSSASTIVPERRSCSSVGFRKKTQAKLIKVWKRLPDRLGFPGRSTRGVAFSGGRSPCDT